MIVAIAAWIALTWFVTRPVSYSPTEVQGPIVLRGWPEHDRIYQQTQFPYVCSFSNEKGAIEYIGARHTIDATEPQLTEIERKWAKFKPTVALCEGRARAFRYARRRSTGRLSESDLTRILARQSGIPLFTLEPTYEVEVARLLEYFEPRLVATYFTLRVYSSESDPANQPQDRLALHLMKKRMDVRGLPHAFATVDELDTYWKQEFPDSPDWRTLKNTEEIPKLRNVGDVSRQVRGEHMVRSLVELANKGERVIAVVGASHVIRQELVLKELMGQ